MKTEKILERLAKYLFITVAVAYLGSLITSYETLWIWIGVSGLLLASNVVEYYLRTRPTLLTKQHELLAKKAENNKIEASQVEEILIYAQEVESENENLKASLQAQEAEVERIEKAYSQLEAKLEKAQAEKSELENQVSELEAKIAELDTLNRQWAADKSSAEKAFHDSLKITKNNNEQSQRVIDGLEANLATAETTISQYAEALSDLIDKFGYRVFSNDWAIFKKGMIELTTKYNTPKMNATTSQESRQALMLTAESVATFAEFLPQEADIIE